MRAKPPRTPLAIHGLGYVGLTAATHFAQSERWDVVGYDPDPHVVEQTNRGEIRPEFDAYDLDIRALVDDKLLRASSVCPVSATVHLVCVPTERNGKPDDTIVLDVLKRLAFAIPTGSIILIESTLTPGTIDRFFLRDPAARTRVLEHRIALAVCPRRDWFADASKNLSTLDRVVGGVTPVCTERALDVLSTVTPIVHMHPTDYRTAEVTKSLENALLHVPVMFAYELATGLPDLDIAEALRLAGTHWRLMPLYLGFGTGGRCVPLGTQYLVEAVERRGFTLELGETAVAFDEAFRLLIAGRIAKLNRPPAIVMGLGYRPNFRDAGNSPGVAIVRSLRKRGFAVTAFDHLWTPDEVTAMTGAPSIAADDLRLGEFGTVVLATPHSAYLKKPVNPHFWTLRAGQIVLDGQGAWAQYRPHFKDAGVRYIRVGDPGWID